MELKLKYRLVWGFLITLTMVAMYVMVGATYGHIGAPVALLTGLDVMIPFTPWAIWIYLSYVPFLFSSLFLAKNKKIFVNASVGVIFIVLFASIIYAFFPAAYPRPDILCNWSNITNCAVWITYQIDPENNTFPSLHVALSWLIALIFKKDGGPYGTLYIWWAIFISISTLLVKQHFLIDVFFSIVLARTVYYLLHFLRNLQDIYRGYVDGKKEN